MSNEKIQTGKFVAYSYKLYNDKDGSLLFETPKDAPDTMIYGVTEYVVPGLTVAMKGLAAGDKFSVTLPPEAAFGDRYDENVMELDKTIFMREGKLVADVVVGAELPMMTQEGFMVKGRVLSITDEKIKMDFNHPFAGLTVRYDGVIDEVRDATPEELQPAHSCCCGHDHDGCEGGCKGHGDHEGGCCGGHDHHGESGCGCHH